MTKAVLKQAAITIALLAVANRVPKVRALIMGA